MGFNSAFKGLKLFKTPGNGRLNNLNDPSRPQYVKLGEEVQFRAVHGLRDCVRGYAAMPFAPLVYRSVLLPYCLCVPLFFPAEKYVHTCDSSRLT